MEIKKGLRRVLLVTVAACILLSACSARPLGAEDVAKLIEIRDACRQQMEEAYWLMYNHVPETRDMVSYHEGRQDEWQPEAYALMLEADQIARTICDDSSKFKTSFTLFKGVDIYEGASENRWYMALEINIHSSFMSIYLVYAPFEDTASRPWWVLDDMPHWFYMGDDYI